MNGRQEEGEKQKRERWNLKVALGLLVTIAIAWMSYYEWQKDRKPAIRYVDYQILGTPGKTQVNFQAHFKNVGKTDATELTIDTRFFTAEEYKPSLVKSELRPHSVGTVGAGLDFYDAGHTVPALDSLFMVGPALDRTQIWWHDRVQYKDEDGRPQPVVEFCMVWDREHQLFIHCPK